MARKNTKHNTHRVRANKKYRKDVSIVQYNKNAEYPMIGQAPYDTNHMILPEKIKDNEHIKGMSGK